MTSCPGWRVRERAGNNLETPESFRQRKEGRRDDDIIDKDVIEWLTSPSEMTRIQLTR